MFNPAGNSKKFINTSHVGAYAQIGDMNIHYLEKGAGEPLLLVHGIGQSLYTWRSNFNELAKKFRVIAVDLLGFGCSDRPEIDYSPEEMAESLRLFLEKLGISRTHIVAFSTGSVYALTLAQKYPMMVDRMILISPGLLPTHTTSMWQNMLLSNSFCRLALSTTSRSKVEGLLYELFFDKTVLTDEVVDQYYVHLETKEQREPIYMALGTLESTDVLTGLRNMKNQVLIIAGRDDPWRDPAEIEEFAAPIPNSYVVFARNCGHMVHEEKPDKVNANIIEFLEWNLRETK